MFDDYVRIFDGDNYNKRYLITQLTGVSLPSNFSSFASKMLIVFDSQITKSHYFGYKGFKANIIFEEVEKDNTTNVCTVLDPCNINEGHCHYDGQCYGTLKCGQNNCSPNSNYGTNCCYDYCGQFLDMDKGILDYFNPVYFYENMQECSWLIQVTSNHIISVEFAKINVSVIQSKYAKFRLVS